MIIRDRNSDIFTVTCDTCGEEKEFDVDGNWDALMSEMKAEGWKSQKVNGEWEHTCPGCVQLERA